MKKEIRILDRVSCFKSALLDQKKKRFMKFKLQRHYILNQQKMSKTFLLPIVKLFLKFKIQLNKEIIINFRFLITIISILRAL